MPPTEDDALDEPAPEPPPKKKRSWRRLALEIGVVLLIFMAVRAWQHRDAAEGPAPALSGVDLAGQTLALPSEPGEPVLVHFWATWCGVCRAEQGTIDGLAEDHRVITVASQSGAPPQVAAYLEEHELDFPVIVDPGGELAQRWGVRAFPTSFVIGPRGTIESVEVGYTTSLGFRARLWLAWGDFAKSPLSSMLGLRPALAESPQKPRLRFATARVQSSALEPLGRGRSSSSGL